MTIRTTFSGQPVFNVDLTALTAATTLRISLPALSTSLQVLAVDTSLRSAVPGPPGQTPYEEWLSRGNVGDYRAFLAAIVGPVVAGTISTDERNRLKVGSDGHLHVLDDLTPDPLAYYILSKA